MQVAPPHRATKTTGGAAGLALLLGLSGEAEARDWEGPIVALTALTALDLSLVVYDTVLVIGGNRPSTPGAIVEVAAVGPQALILGVGTTLLAIEARKGDRMLPVAIAAPTMVTHALTTHGIWSLADDHVEPNELFGVSSAVGINAGLTYAILGAAGEGELSNRPMAWSQLILTAPIMAVGGYKSVVSSDRFGWIALTAWSTGLFAHGAASLFAESAPKDDARRWQAPPFTLVPTLLGGDDHTSPGLAAVGVF